MIDNLANMFVIGPVFANKQARLGGFDYVPTLSLQWEQKWNQ